jgi:hypothetical protein
MTYKFEQFNVEIVDPTIEVDRESIMTNDITKTISCDVKLTTPNGSKFGVRLEDMPRDGQGWDDSDLETMIGIKLQEYAI